jgi:hypothetical protein
MNAGPEGLHDDRTHLEPDGTEPVLAAVAPAAAFAQDALRLAAGEAA